MKWIKLNDGALLNLENVAHIEMFCYESGMADIRYTHAYGSTTECFETIKEAQERLDFLETLLSAN